MVEPETHLAMATRHVAEQRQRVIEQHARISHLRANGLPTDQAERLLDDMEVLLTTMIGDLDRLSN